MYVGVHKKQNQWFRNDTGKLVGTEISKNTSHYKDLSKRIGNQIVIRNTSYQIQLVYYGKFNNNNKFVRVPRSKKSKKACGDYVFVPI